MSRTLRLAVWLWAGMIGGLAVLRVLEGQGLSGWLVAGGLAACGLGAGLGQRRWVARGEYDPERFPGGPTRAMRWSARANAMAAILIAIPVVGMAGLLLLGMIAGMVW